MTENGIKGKAYKLIEQDKTTLVWELWANNVTQGEFLDSQKDPYTIDSHPELAGYYDITIDAIQVGTMEDPEIVGIFVPKDVSEKAVLNALEKRWSFHCVIKLA